MMQVFFVARKKSAAMNKKPRIRITEYGVFLLQAVQTLSVLLSGACQIDLRHAAKAGGPEGVAAEIEGAHEIRG